MQLSKTLGKKPAACKRSLESVNKSTGVAMALQKLTVACVLRSATDLEVGLPLSKSQEDAATYLLLAYTSSHECPKLVQDLLDIAENPVHMGNEIG